MSISVQKNEIFFYIAFTFLFMSFFISDIKYDFGNASSMLRYISYVVLVVQLLKKKWNLKELICFGVIQALCWLFFLITKDIYWGIIVLVIYAGKDIKPENIVRYNMLLVSLGIFFVFELSLFEILPNVSTPRDGMGGILGDRYAFGFVHSDVLPVLSLYLEFYYLWKKKKISILNLSLFISVELIINNYCDSRIAIFAAIIVLILGMIFTFFHSKILILIFEKIVYLAVAAFSIFSGLMTVLLLEGGIYDDIDTFFSGRFRLAILKSVNVGLNALSLHSNDFYFADNIVIDNGYLYIILRYGYLFIGVFIAINYLLVKKADKNPIILICIFAIFLLNFIDNDLLDYAFLPFMIYAFSNKIINRKLE